MAGEDPLTCAEVGPGVPLGWVCTAVEGPAAASEELGSGRGSGPDPWMGLVSDAGPRFEAEGGSVLQCCCGGGVVGGVSVGAVQ